MSPAMSSGTQTHTGLSLDRVMDAFSGWLDTVAGVATEALSRAGKSGSVTLRQDAAGALVPAAPHAAGTYLAPLVKGREVILSQDPRLFLFRPLELPVGAAPFLDGIVRAQIDRLTPWSEAEACYGWTPPQPVGEDRIRLTVAATGRARVAPLLDQLKALGARSVTLATADPAHPDAEPVRIRDSATGGPATAAPVRQALFALLAGCALAALLSLLLADWAGAALDDQRAEIEAETLAARRALLAARDGTGPEAVALRDLEQRKHTTAPVVLVVDALAQALPDNTYLTALEVEAGAVQIMGVSQDAPALIALLERSGRFGQATFASPTTREGTDTSARFHIAAQILATPFLAAPTPPPQSLAAPEPKP